MTNIQGIISQRVAEAVLAAFGEQGRDVDPLVRGSQDDRFGDYQSNCAMSLGKKMGHKPQETTSSQASMTWRPGFR